jgi:hypothetical protein
MPLRISILVLSAAAIAYEVLLIRLFSILQWQQFAAMVISLALLGYGASGTVLSLVRMRLLGAGVSTPGRTLVIAAATFAPLSLCAFLVAQRLPFNPLALVWDPLQILWLLLVYLILAVPFFSVGFSVGLALTVWKEDIPRFYLADLVGAGLGAATVVLLLWVIPPERCLLWISSCGLLAAAVASLDSRVGARWSWRLLLGTAAVASVALPASWIHLRPSEYKSLSRALLVPGSEVVAERSSPLGLLSVVRSPVVPLRYAPGLSLAYDGELPEQLGLYTDGQGPRAIDRRDGEEGLPSYPRFQISSLAYAVTTRPRVLILGLGGGEEIVSALGHGAESVTVIERNRQARALLEGELAEFSGHLLDEPDVEVTIGEVRGVLASSDASWDLIQLTDVQSSAASGGGVGSAGVDYLYTVEGFEELVRHLAPGGVLSVTRTLTLPPRDSLKLFLMAWEAIDSLAPASARDSLAMVRSWDAVTLLLKRGGWSSSELGELRTWSRNRWFDVAFLPDLRPEEPNHFHRLEEPSLYLGARALAGGGREEFIDGYKFQIRPPTDDRPFFSHFFRWRALPELMTLRQRGGAFLLEWGYLVVLGTLLQAILAGSVLILLPLILRKDQQKTGSGAVLTWIYFGALGIGFLFLEIAHIQRVTLYFGGPVFAVATALAAFLVFAGLGSGWAGGMGSSSGGTGPKLGGVLGSIVVLSILYLVCVPWILRSTLAAGLGWKIVISVLVVAPLAFAMGMPFPLALHRLGRHYAARIPWAWAINGWATVVSAALAPLVVIHLGLSALVVLAAVCYGSAAAVLGVVGERGFGPG